MEFGRDSDAVVYCNGTVAWVQAFTVTVPMSYEFRGNAWTGILKVASWTYDESLVRLQPLRPTDVRMEVGITALSDQWAVLSNNGHTEVQTIGDAFLYRTVLQTKPSGRDILRPLTPPTPPI